MLGKSASWVSNRLSLVTRLDANVYELVKNGLLDPRSAEEIARLPVETQYAFAETTIREGLPKSAIESLVAGYNDEGCPAAVKTQILINPRTALARMADKRRSVNTCQPDRHKKSTPNNDIEWHIKAAKPHITTLSRILINEPPHEGRGYNSVLKELAADLSALLVIVRSIIYPGKMEADHNAG